MCAHAGRATSTSPRSRSTTTFWRAADVGARRPGRRSGAHAVPLRRPRPRRRRAWRCCSRPGARPGLREPAPSCVLVGAERRRAPAPGRRACACRPRSPRACASSTRRATCSSCRRSPRATFREPWGLVVNEAMYRGLAVIASDAGRRGRRRARARRRERARGAEPATARALAPRDHAPGGRRRPAQAPGRPRAQRTCCAYSHEAWAEGFSAGACSRSGSPRALVA